METLLQIMLNVSKDLVILVGLPIVIGFILKVTGDKALEYRTRINRRRGVTVFGYIGTPIHELSHAVMALLFGHKINKIVFFKPPSESVNERVALGYVNHSYNPNNLYHRIGLFFIGIAPTIGGVIAIYVVTYFLMPDLFSDLYHVYSVGADKGLEGIASIGLIISQVLTTLGVLFAPQNLLNPLFYLYFYIILAIASHMRLSKEDMQGATLGLITMGVLLVIIESIGVILFNSQGLLSERGGSFIVRLNLFFTQFSILSIVLSGIGLVLSYLWYRVSRYRKQ